MRKAKFNWYKLNHVKMKEEFKDITKYVGTFCVKDEYLPSAVYYVEKPNKKLGHKNYLILTAASKLGKNFIVRGMDSIDHECKQSAIKCKLCNDVIYSVYRHDDRSCKCGKVSIDGGKDYTKVSGSKYTLGTINFLTGRFEVKSDE